MFEAALGICRKRHASVEEAGEDVREFLGVAGVRTVSITEREAETALAAFSRYGRGRGHPAQLNLGDCFAYAMAKNHRTALLFKGEDFDKTDCIFILGQNPGTNSPRMMTSLRNASRRGAAIISFNPFRERALERFQAPQSPIEMAT